MKSKEELSALRDEVKQLSTKLAELNAEELEQIAGGIKDAYSVRQWKDALYFILKSK